MEQAAKEAHVAPPKGGKRLPGEEMKIVNVSSRSFGTQAYDSDDTLKIFNIIMRNAELPAIATDNFYPRYDNQKNVKFEVMESLTSDPVVEVDLGKEIGTAELELPAGVSRDTAIEVTFKLNENGLLELKAKETKGGRIVEASFQTTTSMSEEELGAAIRRSSNSNVN